MSNEHFEYQAPPPIYGTGNHAQDLRFRSSKKFWLLMLSVLAFSWAGWVVIGGFLPLYMIPLFPLTGAMLLSRKNHMCDVERRYSLVYLLFTLCTFFAVFSAEDQPRALIGSLGWLSNYFLIYVSAAVIGTFAEWRVSMLVFTLLQAVSLGFAIPQYFLGTLFISPAAYENQVAGLEGMSYAFGKNYLPTISLGLCAALYRPLLKDKRGTPPFSNLALFALVISMLAIAISESRSSQVAIGLGCMVVGWRAGLLSGTTLKALMIGLLIAGAGLYFGAEKWEKVLSEQGLEGDGSFLYRLNSWGAGWRMAQDHWFAGVGMGNYRYHVGEYLLERLDILGSIGLINSEGELAVEVHNVFIGIGAMAGIPAMVLFCVFYFSIIRHSWRVSKQRFQPRELRFIALVTSLYLIMYLVSLNMHNLFNDNVPWIFIGAYLGTFRRNRAYAEQIDYCYETVQNTTEFPK